MRLNSTQNQKSNNISCKAVRISSSEAKVGQTIQKFDLFRVTKNDHSYLEKLRKRINLKEVMPNLKPEDYFLWQRIVNMLLYQSKYKQQETILLTKDKKVCGGLQYSKPKNNYFIDSYATWPIQKDKREQFAGKVLMLELFNLFMKENLTSIKACVAKTNPFNPLAKFYDLGFRSNGGDYYNELMSIPRKRVELCIEKFAPIVSFKESLVNENINLESLESQR